MRRAVIYFVIAAVCGLIGGVALSGELGAEVTTVDGLIAGTHTESAANANGGRRTVYYVDVLRLDTVEEESVRNSPFYDAYQASLETDVTLEIRDVGSGVDRIASVNYLGETYDGTTEAEGVGVSIAFLVLCALFLALGTRRVVKGRRAPSTVEATPTPP